MTHKDIRKEVRKARQDLWEAQKKADAKCEEWFKQRAMDIAEAAN